MMEFLLLLILGYLVGSVSPGYFFGRLVKGIDIRTFGNKNTGATNTYHVVGPIYGILTGLIDFSKSALVYYFSLSQLKPDLAILAGLTAVLGHIFPFYLGFRGGRGVASLYGLNLAVIFFNRTIFGLFFLFGSIIYVLLVSKRRSFEAPLRKILKLLGIALPFGLIFLPKIILLWIAGFLFSLFFFFDLLRFFHPKLSSWYLKISFLAKQKETRHFSGFTLFLFSTFLLFAFFSKETAVLSLTIFILADLMAPIASRYFLSIKTFPQRTLGGAITVFLTAFITGLFLQSLTSLSLSTERILFAAILATFFDQISFFADDNLLVPLGTALGLTLFRV